MQHQHDLAPWQHAHDFAADRSASERRAWIVVAITVVMMAAEIGAGWWWHSMALLADGWHMGTHAVAIGVAGLSYWLARRWARDARFSLGPWKIEVLGAYTSAVLLAVVAASVAFESALRLLRPEVVAYDESLAVAVVGLVVNAVCAWLLHGGHGHDHDHGHEHDHGPARGRRGAAGKTIEPVWSAREQPVDIAVGLDEVDIDLGADAFAAGGAATTAAGGAAATASAPSPGLEPGRHAHDHGHQDHDHSHGHGHAHADRDLNREAAYTHVLADAATSVLAVGALMAGKWLGWSALDPLVGLLGAGLIAWWARGLLAGSSTILLDREMDHPLAADVKRRLESDGDAQVADLHLWRVGGDAFACAVALVADAPRSADAYRERLGGLAGLAHVTIEVNRCPQAGAAATP